MTTISSPSLTIDLTRAGTLRRLRWLTWFTDNSIRIPGTSSRFGADALLSLVPGAGSLVGAGLSAYLIAEALRFGLPASKVARMGGNVVVDTLIGAVPVVGFFGDIFFKANQRNMAILQSHLDEART